MTLVDLRGREHEPEVIALLDPELHARIGEPFAFEARGEVDGGVVRREPLDPRARDEHLGATPTDEGPGRGQCAVTALLIRELLGGDILVANVVRDGRRVDRHAWNRLPSGLTIDLTREQFRGGERFSKPRVEEPVLTHRNPERFATLRKRVRTQLELD